jgi:biopolymer transport protein ExbB
MLEIVTAGGWLMLPILLSSVAAMAICIERLLVLNPRKVAPSSLLPEVYQQLRKRELDAEGLRALREHSPLGRILAAGIANAGHGRDIVKQSIEDAAGHVVHDLERYLNALGTIAAVTPLLGLLGTVIGMIKVFTEIMAQGTGNASALAGGIAEALITTAAGLSVAIPALIMHRYLTGRVSEIVLELEHSATRLVDALYAGKQPRKGAGDPA